MKEKNINIAYREYESSNELPFEYKELVNKAAEATGSSYAPYSNFHVGAAVLMSNGEIVTGSNQENAAYPSGLCAERVALFYAHHLFPDSYVKAIAITAKEATDYVFPCAACLQVLTESQKRGKHPIAIVIDSASKVLVADSVEKLLPFSFGK